MTSGRGPPRTWGAAAAAAGGAAAAAAVGMGASGTAAAAGCSAAAASWACSPQSLIGGRCFGRLKLRFVMLFSHDRLSE